MHAICALTCPSAPYSTRNTPGSDRATTGGDDDACSARIAPGNARATTGGDDDAGDALGTAPKAPAWPATG